MYAVIAVNTLLVFATAARAQHCWCIESASSGATPFVGQTEDKLVSGTPWEAGAGDVRSAWLAHGAGHGDNRVLAAVFDGGVHGAGEDGLFRRDLLSNEATD